MCETRDLGTKWPHWHTLLFEGQAVDMRVVCPQDVKKMLSKQAMKVCWKKFGSKARECEELKEGVWLEPVQAIMRRKTNEVWTDEHRNVTRKLVEE